MHSLGINGEGEVRGQPANRGLPGKIAVKTVCVCVLECHSKEAVDRLFFAIGGTAIMALG